MKRDPAFIKRPDSEGFTPLHYAARFGQVEAVKWLLANGADVNAQSKYKTTPIHSASNPEILALLLAKKPDLNAPSSSGTPLQNATEDYLRATTNDDQQQSKEIIQLLLKYGAEYDLISAARLNDLARVQEILDVHPEQAGKLGYHTPLRVAAGANAFEVCKYLIEVHQVDVNDFKGGHGYPVIKSALKYPKIVKLLIESGADLDTRITWHAGRSGPPFVIGDEATALHFAACEGTPETIKILMDNGVPVLANTIDSETDQPQKQTALEIAALFGETENAIAILSHLEYRKEAREKSNVGHLDRALCFAAGRSWYFKNENRASLVEVLIQAGANPNASHLGQTAVQYAASSISSDEDEENAKLVRIVKLLEQSGAKIDLYSAVSIGDKKTVATILKSDPARANVRNEDGYPALHQAVFLKRTEILKILLDHGCDVDITSKSEVEGDLGETALGVAAFMGFDEFAKQLIDNGANVNARSSSGETALHGAARWGHLKIAELLLSNGAKLDIRDENGKTPLSVAKGIAMQRLLQAPRWQSKK